MIDIGYSGPRFTWSNHCPLSQLVQERINRVFVNAEWNSLFPEAVVLHLEKTHSDHCPIKLCFEKDGDLRFPKPFRFQPIWLSNPSFPRVVREAWNNTPSLHQALSIFSSKARNWNRNNFGKLFHRKRRILARLKGIQVSMSLRPNAFPVDLERKLRFEYAEVAKIKEEF